MKRLDTYIRKGMFYKAVVEDGSDLIFIVDFKGNILYHNNSVLETLGYRSKSLIGKSFFDYILPSRIEEFTKKFKASQRRSYTEKVEFQFLCRDKSYRFLEFNAINLKNKEGLPGLILDCRDITQSKLDAEELVRLQKAKEQFLANISHEIRTPINGIAGMASLLNQNPNLEERQTYLNAILHSSENLKVIINDILDLTAIESGKLKFERIAFNLVDLLPSIVSTFTYQAREKNLQLGYSIDPNLNRILEGDPVRLNQIIINLISNAVKFTHAGSIQVNAVLNRVQKGVCWVEISVRDTGVGIPSEKLATIFESFSQADESVTRRYGGSGLGLTIARQLVELQNGTIRVESKLLVGSTFRVAIPYRIASAGNQKSLKLAPKQEKDPARFVKDLNVLLVEDNDINRLYAQSILKAWNCKTESAENGLVAIEKVKSNQYDLILMDIQMPVMDGYEATRAIRSMSPPNSTVPIIALTANATRHDIDTCLDAGMNDFIAKPFTPGELFEKISEQLKTTVASTLKQPVAKPKSFDLNYLRNVSGNNESFVKEMVETFIKTIPVSMDAIEVALKQSDWSGVSRHVHQIKPSLGLLGIHTLKEEAMHIEEYSRTHSNMELLPGMIQHFNESCRDVVNDLRAELNSL